MTFPSDGRRRETMTEHQKEVIKRLRRARARIKSGWTQHRLRSGWNWDEHGRFAVKYNYCLVGSITDFDRYDNGSNPAYILAKKLLLQALPVKKKSLETYNDAPKRTKAEVLAVVGKAIDLAKKVRHA